MNRLILTKAGAPVVYSGMEPFFGAAPSRARKNGAWRRTCNLVAPLWRLTRKAVSWQTVVSTGVLRLGGIDLAKKFYVVWAGRETGIFTDWATTQRHVHGFPAARFKSFESRAEAEEAFKAGTPPSAGRRCAAGGPPVASKPHVPLVDSQGVQIYCDGACDPNPGHAGSGIVVYRDGQLVELWYGLYNPTGTNNTAELNALHHALLMAESNIAAGHSTHLLCDSLYAINCISKWAVGWKARGWRKSGGEIKNLLIIQEAHAVYTRIAAEIQLSHVSAHVGTEGNELADRMAMYAVTQRDKELRQYTGALDIKAILRMRAG